MVSQPHIVFLTETWLSNKIPSSLIIGALPFTILRFDRSSRGAEWVRNRKPALDCLNRTAQTTFLSKSRTVTSNFPNVFVRPSLTKSEREAAFLLREKKRQLKTEGKDVLIYAGSIIERSQLEAMKKQVRSSRSHSRRRPPSRNPVSSSSSIRPASSSNSSILHSIPSLLAPQANASTPAPF
ncbi:hypothetical protein PRIPAC_80060 [Pristionchus pacificus]|uniref:Uncharacterized protein n=1 Tax=Pristionchus pacificus TaxID=54126 RepID=A0A2A6CN34_PRIPA|nr:hypothetical protein PRIPAC_80060 [Pristionchus pacificus]|eukprot:PDM79612.1 hypothetical protein PRIPAC_32191 [Pristionchus pacificus]